MTTPLWEHTQIPHVYDPLSLAPTCLPPGSRVLKETKVWKPLSPTWWLASSTLSPVWPRYSSLSAKVLINSKVKIHKWSSPLPRPGHNCSSICGHLLLSMVVGSPSTSPYLSPRPCPSNSPLSPSLRGNCPEAGISVPRAAEGPVC